MNAKETRRVNAIKKAKRKKIMILIVCLVIVATAATVLIVRELSDNTRVFAGGGNQVITLYGDGTFRAQLPHNVRRSGTFTESTEGGVTRVAFTNGGTVHFGAITGRVLTIPWEWEDGCGHGNEFILR